MSDDEPAVVSRLHQRPDSETGAPGTLRRADVLAGMSLVREGKVYDLAVERFRGMPMPAMHPPFEVLPYRTPQGLRLDPTQAWLHGPGNTARMFFTTELVIASMHSGTHFDSLAHVTVGEDDHWYGGRTASRQLTDFGPDAADASALPPIVTRGVLLDVARVRGVRSLAGHEAIQPDDLAAAAGDVDLRRGDVALIRTGYLSHWPDVDGLAAHAGAGITEASALWLADRGVVAVGADTEAVEQLPSASPTNPQPVHTALLIERGIPLIEMVYLEGLAADHVTTCLFIALPTKIRGATGAMADPVAIV